MTSLCNPGYLGTCSIEQAGCKQRSGASASRVLGLQACITTPDSLSCDRVSRSPGCHQIHYIAECDFELWVSPELTYQVLGL